MSDKRILERKFIAYCMKQQKPDVRSRDLETRRTLLWLFGAGFAAAIVLALFGGK